MIKKLSFAFVLVSMLGAATAVSARADSANWPSEATLNQMYVDGYDATVLRDYSDADRIYRGMRPRKAFQSKILWMGGSQCYQRAQVWTYEMAQAGLKPMKVVLWYSDWYYDWYRKHKTKLGTSAWAFHIAPAVYVGGKTNDDLYVLDRGFDTISKPMKLQDWANVFLDEPYVRNCEIVKSAHEYQVRTRVTSAPCMLQIVPMYYYSPKLFDDLEDRGVVIRDFIRSEVKDGYDALSATH